MFYLLIDTPRNVRCNELGINRLRNNRQNAVFHCIAYWFFLWALMLACTEQVFEICTCWDQDYTLSHDHVYTCASLEHCISPMWNSRDWWLCPKHAVPLQRDHSILTECVLLWVWQQLIPLPHVSMSHYYSQNTHMKAFQKIMKQGKDFQCKFHEIYLIFTLFWQGKKKFQANQILIFKCFLSKRSAMSVISAISFLGIIYLLLHMT